MNFQSKGRPLTRDGLGRVCELLGVAEPAVWAVLRVETHGFGFLQDKRPQILFERHVFHRLTHGRHDHGNEDICCATPGGYCGGAGEYGRLERSLCLDRDCALKSASWGIAQIMGFNHQAAGFDSVDAMVAAMVEDEDAQVLAMASFIRSSHLAGALQREDWVAFARGYNGPDYAKNDYDTRLAAADAQFRVLLPDLRLRTAQAALTYLGNDPGPVDGLRGRRTRAALIQFQQRFGLPPTGDLDDGTERALRRHAFAED